MIRTNVISYESMFIEIKDKWSICFDMLRRELGNRKLNAWAKRFYGTEMNRKKLKTANDFLLFYLGQVNAIEIE